MSSRQREIQLGSYLRTKFIDKARIQGIGPARVATLRSYGVETALDVTPSIQVPGIGPSRLGDLLAWRASFERTFRFDPAKGIDPRELNALRHSQASRRSSIEETLENGASQLAALTEKTRNLYRGLQGNADNAVQVLAAAQASIRELPNRLGLA